MILQIKDELGNWVSIPAIKGEKGEPGTVSFEELTDAQREMLKGEPGADGYTPAKGVDYWTAADKEEMVNEVLAALPNAEEVEY